MGVSHGHSLVSQVHEDTGAYGEAAPLASQGTSFTVVLDTQACFFTAGCYASSGRSYTSPCLSPSFFTTYAKYFYNLFSYPIDLYSKPLQLKGNWDSSFS